MGEYEEWAQPRGLLPNGLLPNRTTSVIRILDRERWSKAEERTAELISCIRPNPPSELRRRAVADYVERLIKKCFPCQVFTFGSVPLKTYLPDGDIDLTACSMDPSLKDTWAAKVCDALESEEKDENAEFRVKDVQYIQAEVKLIKCLVENIVVDISFNQVGGLCTLCFLEEVDHLVNHDHLFKRSIILIKAWCYYESRVLGAHHGLISTYALETLVLYIFHVFNNTFAGPLEVLYRFLEFFSNFDWGNFCLSLWGPVPISSLPDITAEPPRMDSGSLLLSKSFLDACSRAYAVENQGTPFVSKHFNVIDPLRVNNNLGRSVSRGNFYRIRSAFDYGAKRLAQLLDCSPEDIVSELNQFFSNTWERHGSGHRPDAPTSLDQVRPLNMENDEHKNASSSLRKNKQSFCESVAEGFESLNSHLSLSSSYPMEGKPVTNDVSHLSHIQALKGQLNNLSMSDQCEMGSSNQGSEVHKRRLFLKPSVVNEQIQGKYLFARTRSSPELTDAYGVSSSRSRQGTKADVVKKQAATTRIDNSRRKNIASETMSRVDNVSSSEDIPSVGQTMFQQHIDAALNSNGTSSNYIENSSLCNSVGEEHAMVRPQGMQQAEQDLVNMMNLSMHRFGGQFPMPLNLASAHLPLPFSPSMISFQRNFAGMIPGNFSSFESSWGGPNSHLSHGANPSPSTQYFPGIGLSSNSVELAEQMNENLASSEMAPGEGDDGFWHERDEKCSASFGDDSCLEIIDKDDRQPSTSGSSTFTQPSKSGGYGRLSRSQQKFCRENEKCTSIEYSESSLHVNRTSDVYSDDRSGKIRFSSASKASSIRSKSSSESSWDGSSVKASKGRRERRGSGTAASPTSAAAVPSAIYGQGKGISGSGYHSSLETDDESRDWNANTIGSASAERSTTTEPESALHLSRNQLSGYEVAPTSQSDSVMSINAFPLDLGSRPKVADNSGMLFYPAGPPVPFLTMLPIYNVPPDGGNSDTSTSHRCRDEGLVLNTNLNQGFKYYGGHNAVQHLNMFDSIGQASTIGKQLEEAKDILQSDFVSHWQNLQYGRSCQNPRYHGPVVYPSPVAVPPTYSQGQFPWDGPGRPVGGANMNVFSQLLNFGPRLLPVAPLHGASNRPSGVYHHYVDDMPRFRGGTGTYLPNPKVSARDRHSSGARRSSYNFDRNDDHADREGNWNAAKARSSGRNHNPSQTDKSNSRSDHFSSGESRPDRPPWTSHQHESSLPSYHAHAGSLRSNSSPRASAYGMYPIPGVHPEGLTSNGPGGPPLVMLYPYDRNYGHVSHSEPLEFSSVGPMSYMSSNEALPLPEGARPRGAFEEQRFHGSSQMSSPDQPSSPHFQRPSFDMNWRG